MHDAWGVFSKTALLWKIDKIVQGKKQHGLKLTGPISHRRGLGLITLGLGPSGGEVGRPWWCWAWRRLRPGWIHTREVNTGAVSWPRSMQRSRQRRRDAGRLQAMQGAAADGAQWTPVMWEAEEAKAPWQGRLQGLVDPFGESDHGDGSVAIPSQRRGTWQRARHSGMAPGDEGRGGGREAGLLVPLVLRRRRRSPASSRTEEKGGAHGRAPTRFGGQQARNWGASVWSREGRGQ